jgi:hypothetical protein
MPKTKDRSPLERATVRLRGGSDLERSLYVKARMALAPRTTLTRTRAARNGAAAGVVIPEDKGFAIFPPGRFPEADQVAADAAARLADIGGADAIVRDSKRKQFMIPIVEQSELDRESALMRLALREDVLQGVSTYLGSAPLLTNLNVYVSRSTDRELMSSQLFHCDADDTRQIKIFVLGNEVTDDGGPLMLMDATKSAELRKRVGYSYRDRVTDEEAEKALDGEPALTAVTGPPGTTCFVDTSRCFHFGSRVSEEAPPRLAAMIQYLTPFSFMLPRNITSKAPFRAEVRTGDSRLQQLALGG